MDEMPKMIGIKVGPIDWYVHGKPRTGDTLYKRADLVIEKEKVRAMVEVMISTPQLRDAAMAMLSG